jgi:hypothetical protein
MMGVALGTTLMGVRFPKEVFKAPYGANKSGAGCSKNSISNSRQLKKTCQPLYDTAFNKRGR